MDDGVPTTCLNPTDCLFIQSYNSLSDDSSSGDDSDPPSFGWLKDRTTQSDVWFDDDDDDDDGGRRSEVGGGFIYKFPFSFFAHTWETNDADAGIQPSSHRNRKRLPPKEPNRLFHHTRVLIDLTTRVYRAERRSTRGRGHGTRERNAHPSSVYLPARPRVLLRCARLETRGTVEEG